MFFATGLVNSLNTKVEENKRNKSMRFEVEQMLKYCGDEGMGCFRKKNKDLFHLSRISAFS